VSALTDLSSMKHLINLFSMNINNNSCVLSIFCLHVIYPSSTLTRDCDIGYSMVSRCMRHLYDTLEHLGQGS
jgi:hypothetical protein